MMRVVRRNLLTGAECVDGDDDEVEGVAKVDELERELHFIRQYVHRQHERNELTLYMCWVAMVFALAALIVACV